MKKDSITEAINKIEEAQREVESEDFIESGSKLAIVKERSETRAHVTRLIIWTYCLFFGFMVFFTLAQGIISSDWGVAVDKVIDISKTLFIPVVTFVIGHYFGSSSN